MLPAPKWISLADHAQYFQSTPVGVLGRPVRQTSCPGSLFVAEVVLPAVNISAQQPTTAGVVVANIAVTRQD